MATKSTKSDQICIKGKGIALVSKYTRFNPARPQDTPAHGFVIRSPEDLDEDGALNSFWAKDGYMYVGDVDIAVTLLPKKTVTSNAVATLRKQKQKLQADTAAECTRIDAQIQSLLAITNEA